MQRKVFLTYPFEDRKYAQKFLKWHEQGKLGSDVVVYTFDDDDLYDSDGNFLSDLANERIRESDMVVVLVGADNSRHPWLQWEREKAHMWGTRRILIRIPFTEGDIPDEYSVLRSMAFNPNTIEKELRTVSMY